MTEAKRRLPVDLMQLLIDRLPQEEIDAARVYLRVLKSREAKYNLWFDGYTPCSLNIHSQREDLLYRSLWFAENHVLSLEQVTAIFRLGLMFREELGMEDRFNSLDLRNLIIFLIGRGYLDLQPDMRLKLRPELAEKAERLTRMETYS